MAAMPDSAITEILVASSERRSGRALEFQDGPKVPHGQPRTVVAVPKSQQRPFYDVAAKVFRRVHPVRETDLALACQNAAAAVHESEPIDARTNLRDFLPVLVVLNEPHLNLVIAALLHDTIEDVGVTREKLTECFGAEVADLVAEVTDNKSLPKEERKRLQTENSPKNSVGAPAIQLADNISNLRGILNDHQWVGTWTGEWATLHGPSA